jgi:hypothetical protein
VTELAVDALWTVHSTRATWTTSSPSVFLLGRRRIKSQIGVTQDLSAPNSHIWNRVRDGRCSSCASGQAADRVDDAVRVVHVDAVS